LESSPDQPAHPGAKVKAIVSDGLNQLVVTGDDSKQLKFWKFQTNKLVKGQIDKRNAGIRFFKSIIYMFIDLKENSSLIFYSLKIPYLKF
jgi:hypothetical protein